MEWLKDPLLPIALAFSAWTFKEIYRLWKSRSAALTEALKSNTDAIHEVKIALSSLEERLKNAASLSSQIPKMQRDLDVAHAHIRIIAPHLYCPAVRAE